MTTQSPHLYARRTRTGAADPAGRAHGTVQTRLPWWAVALPVLAFAALLALVTGGGADAATAAPAGDVLSRAVTALSGVLGHVL